MSFPRVRSINFRWICSFYVYICQYQIVSGAGTFDWLVRAGGPSACDDTWRSDCGVANAVVTGGGRVYSTGSFKGDNADFGSEIMTASGLSDSFVTAISASGTTMGTSAGSFMWTTKGGGSGRMLGTALHYGTRIARRRHKQDALWVSGSYTGDADFGGRWQFTSTGVYDGFLAELDPPTGAVRWVLSFGGANNVWTSALKLGGDKLFMAGRDRSPATFGTISQGEIEILKPSVTPANPLLILKT